MERQITLYTYEIGTKEFKEAADGRYDMVKTKVAEIEAGTCTKTDARAAIKAAGVECPRGTEIYFERVAKVRYYYEWEQLKAIAKNRIALALDED